MTAGEMQEAAYHKYRELFGCRRRLLQQDGENAIDKETDDKVDGEIATRRLVACNTHACICASAGESGRSLEFILIYIQ